jgi:hypothetical protein
MIGIVGLGYVGLPRAVESCCLKDSRVGISPPCRRSEASAARSIALSSDAFAWATASSAAISRPFPRSADRAKRAIASNPRLQINVAEQLTSQIVTTPHSSSPNRFGADESCSQFGRDWFFDSLLGPIQSLAAPAMLLVSECQDGNPEPDAYSENDHSKDKQPTFHGVTYVPLEY